MQNTMQRLLTVTLGLSLCGVARADDFTVTNITVSPGTGDRAIAAFAPQGAAAGQGAALEQQLNASLAQNAAQLTTSVNTLINGINFPQFIGYTANAMSLAGETTAADDASNFDIFSLGVGTGVALSPTNYSAARNILQTFDTIRDGQPVPLSLGVAPAVTLGLNFKRFGIPKYRYFDFSRLAVFLHVGVFSTDIPLTDSRRGDLSYYSWGFAGRYNLLRPRAFAPYGLLRWGGLNVGAGLNASSIRLVGQATVAQQTETTPVTLNAQSLNLNLTFTGSSTLSAHAGAWSIPLEATTSMQLGYLFTFFGGGAVDFNFGTSDLVVDATAPMVLTLVDPRTGRTVDAGAPQGNLTLNVSRHPVVVDVRGSLGLQLNLGVLAVYAQVQGNSMPAVAADFGVRGFW